MTLTCSVDGSADWKYDWFRQTSESSGPQPIRNVNPNRVYLGGIYYCRGGRGDSVFYTEDSNKVTVQETGELSHLFLIKQHLFFKCNS